MSPPTAFINNMRRLRTEQGLTQEQLADRSGLHLTTIARIETGKRDPKVSVVVQIACGLGVPASALMEGMGASTPEPVSTER